MPFLPQRNLERDRRTRTKNKKKIEGGEWGWPWRDWGLILFGFQPQVLGIHANPRDSSFPLSFSLQRFLLFYAFALLDLNLLYQKTDCKLILGSFLSLCLSGKPILCWQGLSTISLFLASFFSAKALYSNLVAVCDCVSFKHGPWFLPFVCYNLEF